MESVESTRRASAMGRKGMVASAHPLATLAGVETLRTGGNAMDAAIAAALTTAVVLPGMNGLGGDAFFLVYEAATGQVTAVNGSGAAPHRVDRTFFIERGYDVMPFYGPLSVSVPGAVDAYFTGLRQFGTRTMADLAAFAIDYAEAGFTLTHEGSRMIAANAAELAHYPTSERVFLPGGRVPVAGTRLRQPALARSLRRLVDDGPDAFYRGAIAREIASFMRESGGMLDEDDFAAHTSTVYTPISTTYRGFTVYETGLPSQGFLVLEELNIIANADLRRLGYNSPDAIHLMVEAKKRAFADRLAYAGDPRFVDVPLAGLIAPGYGQDRYRTIDMERATDWVPPGAPRERGGDTTYLCVVDGQGNAVSLITSLSAPFGSQVVAGDTGILLNNRAGRGFTLEAEHPNVIAPGKRTMHTLNCYLITGEGGLRWVGGTPGGDQQPQWNMQVIVNLIDFAMDPQAAVEAPRWYSFPGTDPKNLPHPFVLRVEGRIPENVTTDLVQRGHRVERLGDWGGGGAAQVIAVDPTTEALCGGSDPRVEGLALGL